MLEVTIPFQEYNSDPSWVTSPSPKWTARKSKTKSPTITKIRKPFPSVRLLKWSQKNGSLAREDKKRPLICLHFLTEKNGALWALTISRTYSINIWISTSAITIFWSLLKRQTVIKTGIWIRVNFSPSSVINDFDCLFLFTYYLSVMNELSLKLCVNLMLSKNK